MSLSNLGGKPRKTAFFKMAAILQVNYSIIQITQKVLDGFSRNLAEGLVPVQGLIGQILKKMRACVRALETNRNNINPRRNKGVVVATPLRFFRPCFQTVRNTVLPFGTMYFTSKPDSFAKFEKYRTVRGGNSIHQKRSMGSDRTTFTFRPLKHCFICIYVRFFALERCALLFPFMICKFYQNIMNIFGVMAPFVLFLGKKWTNDVMVTSYIIIYFFLLFIIIVRINTFLLIPYLMILIQK